MIVGTCKFIQTLVRTQIVFVAWSRWARAACIVQVKHKQVFAYNQFHLILCGQLALWSANSLYVCLFRFLYYLGDHVFTSASQWDRDILVYRSNGPTTRIYRILPLRPFKCNGITTVDKTQAACGWIEGLSVSALISIYHMSADCTSGCAVVIGMQWGTCRSNVLHLCSGLHCIWHWFVFCRPPCGPPLNPDTEGRNQISHLAGSVTFLWTAHGQTRTGCNWLTLHCILRHGPRAPAHTRSLAIALQSLF